MKKLLKVLFILSLFCVSAVLFSCAKTALDFDNLVITGKNVEDISAGTYTLRYTIENLDEYEEKLGVEVSVTVTDKNNTNIEVTNNRTIQVTTDNEYLVTIIASEGGEKVKRHSYTISTIKLAKTITFHNSYEIASEDIVLSVPYGGTLADIPSVPSYTAPAVTGYTGNVTVAKWDRIDFMNITENIIVNTVFEVAYSANSYTVFYETYGGTEIPAESYLYNTTIFKPEDPSKEPAIFFGWYTDEEFTDKFIFEEIGAANIYLYARWITKNENATDGSYFNFELIGDSYKISAKDTMNMPPEVIIPNIYDGKPVTGIDDYGFAQCSAIEKITIPFTINAIGCYAFSGKSVLSAAETSMALNEVIFEDTGELVAISDNAFSYCRNLTSINIPDSIMYIDERAFYECTSLSQITFGENSQLKALRGEEIFYNCSSLSEITLSSKLQNLGTDTFKGCYALTSVTLKGTSCPIGARLFSDEYKANITVYVPEASVSLYQAYSAFENITVLAITI